MTSTPTTLPEGLGQLLRARPTPAPGERCDMCTEPIDATHPHVADLEKRSILCCCPACGMLFTDPAAARGRYRTVPDRWLHDPRAAFPAERWNEVAIPVRLTFFLRNSAMGRVVGFYPGPAGAIESDLALPVWEQLLATTALARVLADDVEALLLDSGPPPSLHLVPVDACYELVARLRLCWSGFDGGEEARNEIAAFLGRVHDRSRPLDERGATA